MKKSRLDLREAIVAAAVAIAERSNWKTARLFDSRRNSILRWMISALICAKKRTWSMLGFDRAANQMLRTFETIEFLSLPPRERLHQLIIAWLDVIAVHRNVARKMVVANYVADCYNVKITIPR
ncbi:MAG: hypothetical protein U1D41_07790 [Nitrosomonas sp.]|uniref:hypothetical protein n=1 Tax=Nitrosomonas sp. TaxID=42353 RepID=UPI002733E135|nr:hypothetical protein [Nitrosomonas sp.]MDP3281614.1 hypothetical protein [Nitrosomonas sp.]MDP3664183.1 hypothetical protein [Nitrosomonas sp.]MDZ4106049.1 hypothetical protein [Nitrosomonas sp.]